MFCLSDTIQPVHLRKELTKDIYRRSEAEQLSASSQYLYLNNTFLANASQLILNLETAETDDFLFTLKLKAGNCVQIYIAKPKSSICDTPMLCCRKHLFKVMHLQNRPL